MYDYKKALIPAPQRIEDGGKRFSLAGGSLTAASCDSQVFASAVAILEKALQPGDFPVRLELNAASAHKEGYQISIDEAGARIVGADPAGAFYGAITFQKLLHEEGGKLYLPVTEIEDWPDFPERGLFLEDRYGSEFMTLADYKEAIDYFADMKLNSLTIGIYGCWSVQYDNRVAEYLYLPFEKYPQLKTPMSIKYYRPETKDFVCRENVLPTMFENPFFGDIIRYAAKKNIRVRPLFNSYGHNNLLPREIPEISAKDENGKPLEMGFCTSNEKTYEVLFDIYDNIIDNYLAPNGVDEFHIGLDEVMSKELCQCEKCRGISGYKRAMEHAIRLIRHLKGRGMHHVHMYYDTIFGFFRTSAGSFLSLDGAPSTQEEVDAYVAQTAQRFKDEGIYDVTVLDWWNYFADEKMFYGRELNSSFRSVIMPMTGYYHWLTPMERNDNIRGGAKRAVKHGFEGLCAYSSLEYCFDRPYRYLASVAWNKGQIEDQKAFYDSYAYALCPEAPELTGRAIEILGALSEDDRRENPIGKLGYYWTSYKRSGKPYPRCWFEELKANIDKDPDKLLPSLTFAKEGGAEALSLLEKAPIKDATVKKALIASAWHFAIHGECYEILYDLLKNKRTDFEQALTHVIGRYEVLLQVAKVARREYTYYHYARDLSIQRELCVNALEKLGKDPSLSLPDTERMGSPILSMLR